MKISINTQKVIEGGGGTNNHSELQNLDYEHSGHTGFQPTLVSGQNIKTINNQSILGTGNINIEGGSGGLSSVAHDNTMTGAGTNASPLSVVGGGLSGNAGVEIGPEEPTDDSVQYWIDTTPPFSQMKIGCLGDSITAGVGASKTYVKWLQQDFKTVVNYGVSGSCITTGANNIKSFCTRALEMAADLDAVIVYGGTNDLGHNANFGTEDNSTDDTVFKGAINVLITSLMDRYPEKPILMCFPTPRSYGGYNNTTPNQKGVTLEMIKNQMKARCEYYSMPYLDLYGQSGMNISYSSTQRSRYTSDGLHLNDKGHKRIYDLMIKKLKEITNVKDYTIKAKQNGSWVEINASYLPEDSVVLKGSNTDERELVSISATYTQGGTKVYPDTPLNDLKANLVVRANYNDGSTDTVPANAYTLSGTLVQGTSTVTVSYLGKTTTFTVTVSAPKAVTGITATYNQGSTVVYPDTSLNDLKSNLTVVKLYNDGTSEHLAAEEYTLSGTLSVGTSTITVTYQSFSDTFDVTVSQMKEVTGIKTIFTQGANIIYPDTPLNDLKTYLVVEKEYNDGTSEVLTANQYTLSGTLSVGTSTITATYSSFTDTFDVTVSIRPELVSITADYDQSGVVYSGQNLDTLKADLLVTANYSDSSTEVVTNYTLTGTLAEGTSTITVNYEGKTDTFDVTVSSVPDYTEFDYIEGDGAAYVVTDYKPTMKDSMEFKFNNPSTENNENLIGAMNSYSIAPQYGFAVVGGTTGYMRYGTDLQNMGNNSTPLNQDHIINYTYNSSTSKMDVKVDGTTKVNIAVSSAQLTQPIDIFAIGCTVGKTTQDFAPTAKIFKGKIYYAKFWDEQGNLIRHFVGARKNSTGEIGIYDKVTDTFYSKTGTGSFTPGGSATVVR